MVCRPGVQTTQQIKQAAAAALFFGVNGISMPFIRRDEIQIRLPRKSSSIIRSVSSAAEFISILFFRIQM